MSSMCGADCSNCNFRTDCKGCVKSDGCPFGEKCFIAEKCKNNPCGFDELKSMIIERINSLKISDTDTVNNLYALKGSFINMSYTLPNGETVKFLDDNRIYLGTQQKKYGTDKCYGIAADENFVLVSEYGENGTDPEIRIYKEF